MCQSGTVTETAPLDDPTRFDCPRCGEDTTQVYWGPCGACRAELRATWGNEAREIQTAAYEPKMNVTPNAVATKD